MTGWIENSLLIPLHALPRVNAFLLIRRSKGMQPLNSPNTNISNSLHSILAAKHLSALSWSHRSSRVRLVRKSRSNRSEVNTINRLQLVYKMRLLLQVNLERKSAVKKTVRSLKSKSPKGSCNNSRHCVPSKRSLLQIECLFSWTLKQFCKHLQSADLMSRMIPCSSQSKSGKTIGILFLVEYGNTIFKLEWLTKSCSSP